MDAGINVFVPSLTISRLEIKTGFARNKMKELIDKEVGEGSDQQANHLYRSRI